MNDTRATNRGQSLIPELQGYLDLWLHVLPLIRGCTAEEVRKWAGHFSERRSASILHEPATYWAAPALVPPEFIPGLKSEKYAHLLGDLQFALDRGDNFWFPTDEREFLDARDRVNRVLENYRSALPPHLETIILTTNLPRGIALEIGLKSILRYWPRSVVRDPVRDRAFDNLRRIPFGSSSRLEIHRADGGRATLWVDAFGLNLVATSSSDAEGALNAVRSAIDVNPYHGEPTNLLAA